MTVTEICQRELARVAEFAAPDRSPRGELGRGGQPGSAALRRTVRFDAGDLQRAFEHVQRQGPRYPAMTASHRRLVAAIKFDTSSNGQKALHAFQSVPRRLFAPTVLTRQEEAKIYDDSSWIASRGYFHMSQPSLYAQALTMMRINDDIHTFSFLNIGGGTGECTVCSVWPAGRLH